VCELKRWVTTSHAPPPDLHLPIEDDGPDVAVVGAGPAGLAAAHDLALAGARVTLLDRADRPGGLLNGCIPEFRLPASVAEADIERIMSLGIEFRSGFVLRAPEQLETLRGEGFAAVLLAVGAGDDREPNISGWKPGPANQTAIAFLREVRGQDVRMDGRRVSVIGGGNGAIDVARVAQRLGAAEVRILYRRSRDELPAFPDEVALAVSEGIRIESHTVIDAIEWSDSGLRGIRCSRSRTVARSGPRSTLPQRVAGTEHFVSCDIVIAAIGQTATLPSGGWQVADVFTCDAALCHSGTVVSAIASGRRAAAEITSALGRSGRWRSSGNGGPRPEPVAASDGDGERPTEGVTPHTDGIAPFLPRHVAASEASRCLGCDRLLRLDPERCILCGKCSERCAYDALSWHLTRDGASQLVIRDEDCQRCGDCIASCPSHALRWRPWRQPNRFCTLRTSANGIPGEVCSNASAGEV
jgi:NADPH-dependent 2,4-dienoyl-CoA reductase/sulfur reductase-like enzyme/NAD-dependent dihydropyrimidine dehydrogenase PreA subunit